MFGTGVKAWDGYKESWDTANRQRADLAKAFEEFKKNNPYATAADFQAWIDMHAGGDNYLRAGLPGREVLSRLEQDGQERRRRDTVKAQLEEMHERARTDGMVDSMIQRAILNSDSDDPDEIYGALEKQFGPDVAQQFGLRGQVNHARIKRERANRELELIPSIMQIIRSMPDVSTVELGQRLGITSKSLLENARLQAEARLQQENAEKFFASQATISENAQRLAARGVAPEAIIDQLAARTGFSREQIAPLVEQATTDAEDTRRRSEFAHRRELRDYILNTPTIVSLVRQNNRADAVRRIQDLIDDGAFRFSDAGKAAESIYEDVVDQINQGMIDKFNEVDLQRPAAETQLRERLVERNADHVSQIAGKDWQQQPVNQGGLGLRTFNTNIQRAVARLGQSYDLSDPATASAIKEVIADLHGRGQLATSEAGIIEQIAEDGRFAVSARSFEATLREQRELMDAQNPRPMHWPEYVERTDESISTDAKEIELFIMEQLREIDQIPPTEVQQIARKINVLTRNVDRRFNHVFNLIDTERRNASRWLHAGHDFDMGQMGRWRASIEAGRSRVKRLLEDRLMRAVNVAQQQAGPAEQGGPAPGDAAPAPAAAPRPLPNPNQTELRSVTETADSVRRTAEQREAERQERLTNIQNVERHFLRLFLQQHNGDPAQVDNMSAEDVARMARQYMRQPGMEGLLEKARELAGIAH